MTDLSNIIRADFIAGHRARVAQITAAEIHAAEHSVRDGLAICESHQQRAYRSDVTALLAELGYEYEMRDDLPALRFDGSCAEQDRADFLLEFGYALARYMPRRAKAVMRAVRADGMWLVFGSPVEPDGSDYPYGAV